MNIKLPNWSKTAQISISLRNPQLVRCFSARHATCEKRHFFRNFQAAVPVLWPALTPTASAAYASAAAAAAAAAAEPFAIAFIS